MAKKKLNDFKKRLMENKGKSFDGKKINGIIPVERLIEISDNNKILKLEISTGNLTEEIRDNLQLHCKSIVGYIDKYNVGDKILLSKCSDTIYDFQVLSKEKSDGIYSYNLQTI